jgi:hypothetical protein
MKHLETLSGEVLLSLEVKLVAEEEVWEGSWKKSDSVLILVALDRTDLRWTFFGVEWLARTQHWRERLLLLVL